MRGAVVYGPVTCESRTATSHDRPHLQGLPSLGDGYRATDDERPASRGLQVMRYIGFSAIVGLSDSGCPPGRIARTVTYP